jgi:hypothetical protein
MLTSKYLKLSSWGTAEIPGTLWVSVTLALLLHIVRAHAYGSAINLSVSLMILFGSAIATSHLIYLYSPRIDVVMRSLTQNRLVWRNEIGVRFVNRSGQSQLMIRFRTRTNGTAGASDA